MIAKLIIAGLGNPGQKYDGTRHNIGFDIIDCLASKLNTSFNSDKKCQSAKILYENKNLTLLKPLEFMNLSGNGVANSLRREGVPPNRLLVIHDEIDFPFSKIKMKIGGGNAGHNGLKDIIEKIGSKEFHRLRVGVGRPENSADVADYVLSRFSSEEREKLSVIRDESILKILDWIKITT